MSKRQFHFNNKKTRTLDIVGHEFVIEPLEPKITKKLYTFSEDFQKMKDAEDSMESILAFNEKTAELVDYLLGEGANDKIFADIDDDSIYERLELIQFLQEEFLELTQAHQQKFDVSRIKR